MSVGTSVRRWTVDDLAVRRPLAVLAFASALTAVASPSALAQAPTPSLPGPQEIAFLNAQRAANGLPADVTEDPALTAGCAAHMNYIRLNDGGQLTHVEVVGRPGYTPEGAAAAAASVLTSGGSAFSATGVNNFETAPIHLMQMLSPWITSSGAADGCLNTLSAKSRPFATQTTFSYPGDGSTSVPVSETASEGPFVPGAFVGLADKASPIYPGQGVTTGPHLFFYYAGPPATPPWSNAYYDSRGHFTAATLTGPAGAVAIRTVDNDTSSPDVPLPAGVSFGDYLPPGGMIIPVAPLTPNQKYTASVTYQPEADNDGNGVPDLPAVSRTWSFSAGVVAPPTPTPAATPKPIGIIGTPPPTPVKPVLTKLSLKARALSVKSTTSASLWATIEQHVRRSHGRKLTWKLRRSQPLPTTAGAVAKVALKKLGKGEYRVRIFTGTATGVRLLSQTLKLK